MMNARASAGPAWLAAATPVRTKIPVPMMPPIPSAVRAVAERTRLSFGPLESSACRSEMDLVAKSWLAIKPKPPTIFAGDCGGTSAFAQLLRYVRGEQLDQGCVNF